MIAGHHIAMGGKSGPVAVEYLEMVDPHEDTPSTDYTAYKCIHLWDYAVDNYEMSFGFTPGEVTGGNINGTLATQNGLSGIRFFNWDSRVYLDQGPQNAQGRLTGNANTMPVGVYHDWVAGNRYVKQDGTQILSGSAQTGVSHGKWVCLAAKGKLYYFMVKMNGSVVFYGVPARVGQLGVLYDKITGNFATYNGDSPLQLGQDVGSALSYDPVPSGGGVARCIRQLLQLSSVRSPERRAA